MWRKQDTGKERRSEYPTEPDGKNGDGTRRGALCHQCHEACATDRRVTATRLLLCQCANGRQRRREKFSGSHCLWTGGGELGDV